MTLKEFADEMFAPTKSVFAERQSILQMWFIDNGKINVVSTPWTNDGEKDAACQYIRDYMKAIGANRYAMISEVWQLSADKDTGLPDSLKLGGSIASHPDRREAVFMIAQDKSGQTVTITSYILRPEHGKATLSEPIVSVVDADGSIEGRMVNMLEG